MNVPAEFIDWLKKSPLALTVMLIFALLLGVDGALPWFDLETFRRQISIGFIGALVVTFSQFLLKVEKWVEAQFARHTKRQRLNQLTNDERKCLGRYVINDRTRTQNLDCGSGVVAALVKDGILYRADVEKPPGKPKDRSPFNMEPWVLDYLITNPDLLSDDKVDSAKE